MQQPKFEGAELTIYITDSTGQGRNLNIDISEQQLIVIRKALGIEFNQNSTYSCFGDSTLANILSGKINPFRLQEKQ